MPHIIQLLDIRDLCYYRSLTDGNSYFISRELLQSRIKVASKAQIVLYGNKEEL